MISIDGRRFSISEIINEYPPNSVERQLLTTMSESPENYRYNNLDQLRFELVLRREIANSARQLNASRFSFAVFHSSRCNPVFWNRTSNGGFELRRDATASQAINDIFSNGHLYATECATAMVIVYYKALLNVYGEQLFNQIFPYIFLLNWHNIDPKLREIGYPETVRDILIGDRCYVNNPDVSPSYPEFQGENIIALGNSLYYGHGIGITTLNRIISILNSKRKRNATSSAYFMENTAARPDFIRLSNFFITRG